MTRLLLLGPAREAAGVRHDEVGGGTVGEVLDAAKARYGATFAEVLATSQVWLNGDEADDGDLVSPGDEVAILPPISGG